MVDFAKDGKTCLVLSTLGRETTGLVRMDVATGKVTTLTLAMTYYDLL